MNVHAIHVGQMTGAREEHERQKRLQSVSAKPHICASRKIDANKERKKGKHKLCETLSRTAFLKNICILIFSIFGVFIQNKSLE